jgi:hypothetical protein
MQQNFTLDAHAPESLSRGAPARGNIAHVWNRRHEPLEPVAQLRARADLRSIVEGCVKLERHERHRHEWLGLCPFHPDTHPSLKVNTDLQKYKCWACGEKGDALDFVQRIHGLSFREAGDKLRELIGTGDQGSPITLKHRDETQARQKADDTGRRAEAWAMWQAAEPISWRTESKAQQYLTQRRGIRFWLPHTLRWHPEAFRLEDRTMGGIVARVDDASGDFLGIWRIRPAMVGKVLRGGLGPVAGGAVRLFDAAAEVLVIAEGIEDALAAHALTGWPAWAAVSAPNMKRIQLPPPPAVTFRVVEIHADADEAGMAAAEELATRLRREGHEARVRPPAVGKDPNEALLAGRAA